MYSNGTHILHINTCAGKHLSTLHTRTLYMECVYNWFVYKTKHKLLGTLLSIYLCRYLYKCRTYFKKGKYTLFMYTFICVYNNGVVIFVYKYILFNRVCI